jgi:16S rRNA (uracil1498-N3)-methyltransferase
MRTIRLYTPQQLQAGGECVLEAGASHHLATVLRARTGQAVELFNGDGCAYQARITAIAKKSVTVEIDNRSDTVAESPLQIELGIAISKGDRFDFVLQKSTELGVTCITPLLTGRTEVRLDRERAERKAGHWRQIVIGACEQCGRNVVPQLNAVSKLDDWLTACDAQMKFVLHHRAAGRPATSAAAPQRVALLIGPEGGLAADEIAAAEQRGFIAWRIGPRVLRTETAPLAAITTLQWLWGDLQQ